MSIKLRLDDVYKCKTSVRVQEIKKGPYDTTRGIDFFSSILEKNDDPESKARLKVLDAVGMFGFESWYFTWLANRFAEETFESKPINHFYVYIVRQSGLLDHWQRFDPDLYAQFMETVWWKHPIIEEEDRRHRLLVLGNVFTPIYHQMQGSSMTEFVIQNIIQGIMSDYAEEVARQAEALPEPPPDPKHMIFDYQKRIERMRDEISYEEFAASEERYRRMLSSLSKKHKLPIPLFRVGGLE